MKGVGLVRFAGVLLLGLLLSPAARAEAASIVGIWLHANERIEVEITPCGDRLCGDLVWFRWPNDEAGRPLVDLKNPDAGLRNRPLLGMTVLRGLKGTDPGTWIEGRIYNPDDGADYQALLSLQDDDTLRVRAYVLLPFLGKNQVWTRVR